MAEERTDKEAAKERRDESAIAVFRNELSDPFASIRLAFEVGVGE